VGHVLKSIDEDTALNFTPEIRKMVDQTSEAQLPSLELPTQATCNGRIHISHPDDLTFLDTFHAWRLRWGK
jgi:hypothetical protein